MKLISKITIFLIASIIIFNSAGGFLKPKEAETVWWSTFPQQIVQQAVDIAYYLEVALKWVKDDLMKALRDAIVKRLLDYITDQTIAWINGGGTPQFISDWQGFLRQVANVAVGDVIEKTNAAFLCSPFKFQVSLALLPTPKYTQNISCTFDKIVGNLDAFYKDFRKGSWLGYTTAWAPENNYYGTLIRVHDEITQRTAASQTAAQNQGISDKGYLPVQSCTQWDTSAAATACDGAYESCIKDDGLTEQECLDLAQKCTEQNRTCVKKETKTPGDAIGAAVATAIGSDSQYLAGVQSAISAITNALINKLIKKGLIYAVGSANEVSYSGGEYTLKYESVKSGAANTDKKNMTTEMKSAIAEWEYLLAAKTSSLINASSTLEYLRNSSLGTCRIGSREDSELLPALTVEDINKAQADVDRLKMETDVLREEINDVSAMVAKIEKADLTDLNQMSDVQADYMRFVDGYDTDEAIRKRADGSAREAADSEKANTQSAAETAAQRASSCPLQI